MLTRYQDIVPVVPAGVAVQAGTPAASGAYRYQFVVVSNRHRVRQTGTIVKVRMWIGTLTNVTNFRVQVWRPNRTNLFYEVGITENFIGTVTPNSINTITLSSPIANVQQGDYIGALIESSAVMTNMIGAVSLTNTTTYRLTDFGAKYGSFDWIGSSTANGATSVPIECFMQAPDIVCIGDSIDEGWSYHTAETDTVNTGGGYNQHATYMAKLAQLVRERFGYDLTWQNVSIGGQTSAQIQARFAADALALYPRIIICGMGNNDINTSVPEATFLANYQLVANACEANVSGPDPRPAKLIARLMPPHTGWTNVQHQTKDLWNADLIAQLAANNPTARVVDVAPRTGQFRAGGDAGNLWDIQARYLSGDGMAHQNPLGLSQYAYAIMQALGYDDKRPHWSLHGRHA